MVFTDSVSTFKNSANYCGQYIYALSPEYSFLSISGNSIVLMTSNLLDIGIYTDSILTVSLADYPTSTPFTSGFKVTIQCLVAS